jgi:hypothetical protein
MSRIGQLFNEVPSHRDQEDISSSRHCLVATTAIRAIIHRNSRLSFIAAAAAVLLPIAAAEDDDRLLRKAAGWRRRIAPRHNITSQ